MILKRFFCEFAEENFVIRGSRKAKRWERLGILDPLIRAVVGTRPVLYSGRGYLASFGFISRWKTTKCLGSRRMPIRSLISCWQ